MLLTLAIMGMRAITLVARFALTMFIAQLMGLPDLGLYGLALATVSVAPVLLGLGLNGPLTRRVVHLSLSDALPLIWTQFVFTALTYCLILPIAWALNAAIGFLPTSLAVLLGLVVFLEHESQNNHNQLVSRGRPALAASLLFVRGGVWPGLFMYFAFRFLELRSIEALCQFWILGLIAPYLVLIGYLAQNGRWRHIKLLKAAWLKEHLPKAYRFYLQDVAYGGYQFADRFIVAKFLGLEATGIYTFFWSIANAVYSLINSGITAPYFPKLAGAAKGGDVQAFRQAASRLQWETWSWSIGISFCFLAAMPLLLEHLHRPQLAANIWVFWLLMPAIVLRMISENYSIVLYAASRDWAMAWGTLFGLGFAIISTAISAPLYGLAGVSVACLATSGAMLCARYRLTRPLLRTDRRTEREELCTAPHSPVGNIGDIRRSEK